MNWHNRLNNVLSGTTSALYNLFSPLVFHFYLWWHSGKYGAKTYEKFGYAPLRRAERPCLLIHAVSVGEAMAAQTIIDEFTARHPDWDIFVTVSTVTARVVAAKKYGEHRVCYYPLDGAKWVNRFFLTLRPTVIVLIELEVWPMFLAAARQFRVPVIVANARITEESVAKYERANEWRFLRRLLLLTFNSPAVWLAQTQEYAARLHKLGVAAKKIRVNGNVKFDQVPKILNTETGERYREKLAVKNKLIVAGSTHFNEEEMALLAWRHLRNEHFGLKLVIVPRHPERLAEVMKTAEEYGKSARWQEIINGKLSAEEIEIIIVDTVGELANFYAAADAVFVGGTLIPHGGQNMAEPCGLAKPTVIGASYFNFTEMVNALLLVEGILVIRTPEELAAAFHELLLPEAIEYGERARNALLSLGGSSRRVAETIEEVLAARTTV